MVRVGESSRGERVTRIELASSAWKAEVLPLNYTRKIELHPVVQPNSYSCNQIVTLICLATERPSTIQWIIYTIQWIIYTLAVK